MKQYTLCLLAFVFVNGPKDRQLSYSDFKGHGQLAALTTSCIDLNEESTDGRYTFSVSCYFVPQESYINIKTPEILAHENTHLKISYVYARQLDQICKAFKGCDSSRAEIIRAMYKQITDEWQATEQKFDDETNHSRNRESEIKWEEKIKNKING